jgi:ElaB/YqjD/DUF883 family membrane-anchored ribosome-binding protein
MQTERDTHGETTSPARHGGTDSMEQVHQDMEATRERMAHTAHEIESRISGKVQAVKDRLDVASVAREHPWPAIAIAVAAGIALSTTGMDGKAASATVDTVKRSPRIAKSAAVGAGHLAVAGVKRLRGKGSEDSSTESTGSSGSSRLGRLKENFATQARQLGEELGRAAHDILMSSRSRGGSVGDGRVGASAATHSATHPAAPGADSGGSWTPLE